VANSPLMIVYLRVKVPCSLFIRRRKRGSMNGSPKEATAMTVAEAGATPGMVSGID
jgi:hypothetical protein